jgi:hypothetical protein
LKVAAVNGRSRTSIARIPSNDNAGRIEYLSDG